MIPLSKRNIFDGKNLEIAIDKFLLDNNFT